MHKPCFPCFAHDSTKHCQSPHTRAHSEYNLGIEKECAFGVPSGWQAAANLGYKPPNPYKEMVAKQKGSGSYMVGGNRN